MLLLGYQFIRSIIRYTTSFNSILFFLYMSNRKKILLVENTYIT